MTVTYTICEVCSTRVYYWGDYPKKLCDPCRAKTDRFIRSTWNYNLSRARRKGLPASLTLQEWKQTLIDFDYRCAYCGKPYTLLEHFISVSKGGGTTVDNCVPSCNSCNVLKETIGKINNHPGLKWWREKSKSVAQYLANRK